MRENGVLTFFFASAVLKRAWNGGQRSYSSFKNPKEI
jgi:hypothetical protein